MKRLATAILIGAAAVALPATAEAAPASALITCGTYDEDRGDHLAYFYGNCNSGGKEVVVQVWMSWNGVQNIYQHDICVASHEVGHLGNSPKDAAPSYGYFGKNTGRAC
ncbi:hypothetical protein ABT256_29055 [Amycolatopsis japonica]|uniref:hypothetical protein n=1 Tax=Amycolatopsis japonica TaxID=208439 RepID=UPI0033237818